MSLLPTVADRVDDVFRRFFAAERVPGLVYGVVSRTGLVHSGAVGMIEVGTGREVGVNSVFRIASMTKSLTAACVLMLRDRRKLDLDQPLADFVSSAANLAPPTQDSGPITIRHLLTMSAGLVEDDPWADRQLAMPATALEHVLRTGVHFNRPPGIAFEYSNLGYALLGTVLSRVTGESVAEYSTRNLLRPLGMSASGWEAGAIPDQVRVRGYRRGADVLEEVPPLSDGVFGAMGGLWTTIPDFARYVAFQLDAWPSRDGKDAAPLSRATRREMQQPHRRIQSTSGSPPAPGGVTTGYGFGLFCGELPTGSAVVYHGGGLPGFGSHVRWLPEQGLGVVAFANMTYAPVSRAVIEALECLGSGDEAEASARGAALLQPFEATLLRLYQRWDDATLLGMAADNLLQDRELELRRAEVGELRARLGAPTAARLVRSSGRMRGTWMVDCERGALEIEAWVAPPEPSRLQVLRFREVEPAGREPG